MTQEELKTLLCKAINGACIEVQYSGDPDWYKYKFDGSWKRLCSNGNWEKAYLDVEGWCSAREFREPRQWSGVGFIRASAPFGTVYGNVITGASEIPAGSKVLWTATEVLE